MQLYVAGGVLLLVLGLVAAAYIAGRRSGATTEQAKTAERTGEIQHAQLEDSTLARDPAAVAERLRQHQF